MELVNHLYLDEAGDTTFYSKGKKKAIGKAGVSNCFIPGMVKIHSSLNDIRKDIQALQVQVADNALFQTPSLLKITKPLKSTMKYSLFLMI